MSKFTSCYRALQVLITIDIDKEPDYEKFLNLYQELSVLGANKGDTSTTTFDPRKSQNLVGEFEHLLNPQEFKSVTKEFKLQVKVGLLRKALNHPDKNGHTPLHIASYFGDFKSQKFMVDLGAVSNPKNCAQRPLEIGKDKFARGVLQKLGDAATESNFKDIGYLVNCGENIDKRSSITLHAPIHNAVLASSMHEDKK